MAEHIVALTSGGGCCVRGVPRLPSSGAVCGGRRSGAIFVGGVAVVGATGGSRVALTDGDCPVLRRLS